MNPKPQLDELLYFPTVVNTILVPEFIEELTKVSKEYLEQDMKERPLEEADITFQSQTFSHDMRIKDFKSFIEVTSQEILNKQGYMTDNISMLADDIWIQSHRKHSSMEVHTHGYNAQISGFYILQCDDKSGPIVFHDPRPAKQQSEMPERNFSEFTLASKLLFFPPEPGRFFFTNSWLPHSFGRNCSENPFNFIHFNVYPQNNNQEQKVPVII